MNNDVSVFVISTLCVTCEGGDICFCLSNLLGIAHGFITGFVQIRANVLPVISKLVDVSVEAIHRI